MKTSLLFNRAKNFPLFKTFLVSTAIAMQIFIHLPALAYEGVEYESNVNVYDSMSQFSDTTTGTPVATASDYLYYKNIIGGFADGTFRPDQKVNRAEAAKFFTLAAKTNLNYNAKSTPFRDVIVEEWYGPYVLAAAEAKIINGHPNGNFRPQDGIQRSQFLAMLARAFDLPSEKGSSNFTDVEPSAWYAGYTELVDVYDLFAEDETPATLNPAQEMTRAEFALGLHRYLKTVQPLVDDEIKQTTSTEDTYPDYNNVEVKQPHKPRKNYVQNWWKKVVGTQEYKAFLKANNRYMALENSFVGEKKEFARFYVKNSPSTDLEIRTLYLKSTRSLGNEVDLYVTTNANGNIDAQAHRQLGITQGVKIKGTQSSHLIYKFTFDETVHIDPNEQNTFIVWGEINSTDLIENGFSLALDFIDHTAYIDEEPYEKFKIIHEGKSLGMNAANLVSVSGIGKRFYEEENTEENTPIDDVKVWKNNSDSLTVIGGADDVTVGNFSIQNNSAEDIVIENLELRAFGNFTDENYSVALYSDGIQRGSEKTLARNGTNMSDISVIVTKGGTKNISIVIDTREILTQEDLTIEVKNISADGVGSSDQVIIENDEFRFESITILSKPSVSFSTQLSHTGIAEIQAGQRLRAFNVSVTPAYDDVEIQQVNLEVVAPNFSVREYLDFVLVTPTGQEFRVGMNNEINIEFALPNHDRMLFKKDITTRFEIFVEARENIPEGKTIPFELALAIPEYVASTNGANYPTNWVYSDRALFDLVGESVQTPVWSSWMDRDDAGGTGDWETLSDFRAEGHGQCDEIVAVECQTVSGLSATTTGEIIQCTNSGLVCKNDEQNDGFCEDYRVRFQCLNN
jgi:hypothetical protein